MIKNLNRNEVLEMDSASKIVTLTAEIQGNVNQIWLREESANEVHFTLRIGENYLTAIGEASQRGQIKTPIHCKQSLKNYQE